MNEFSFKRVFTNVKNSFKINRSIPALILITVSVVMFLSTMLPVSEAEDGYVAPAVDPERYENYLYHIEYAWESIMQITGIQAVMASITAVGVAFLCAVSLSAWSRDKRSLDFWDSAPITRREHLVSGFVSGFLYFFISIVPSWYLSLIIAWSTITVKPLGLGQTLLDQTPVLLFILLFYLAILATAFLSVTVAGSVMSALVVFGTSLGYPALAVYFSGFVSDSVFHTSLMSTFEHDWSFFAYSSPVLRYSFSGTRTYPMSAFDYVYFALWAVVLAALAIYLVKKRRNELCRNALIFPSLRYPLQYMWAFFFTLFAAWFLYVISYNPIWFVIGALIGAALSFVALNMIFERSLTGAFKKLWHLPVFSAAFVLITVIFVADVFGIYKNPTPDFDKVYDFSATLYIREADGEEIVHRDVGVWSDANNLVDTEEERELIRALWESMRAQEQKSPEEDFDSLASLTIRFWCKGDPSPWYLGTTVYDCDLDEEVFLRFSSLLECFESSFDETREPASNEEEATSIIGGADSPTSITVY